MHSALIAFYRLLDIIYPLYYNHSMKQVLLIDVAPTLKNYIAKKLHEAEVLVLHTDDVVTAFEFMKKSSAELAVIDYTFSRDALFNFLDTKQRDPEIADMPAIVLASTVGKHDSALLASYGVKKIIEKPVHVDELLSAIGLMLGVSFQVDRTPCILETRVNEDIIFIEIAQGLNRDKLELLQFRIIELIELYKLPDPKVLIIMTDLNLTYTDVPNLEYLIDRVLAVKSIDPANIKFLTLNKVVTEFFNGHPEYKEISAVTSLSEALSSFADKSIAAANETAQELLQPTPAPTERPQSDLLETRFKMDMSENLSVAVIDDDLITRKMITAIFYGINATVFPFENGEAFFEEFTDERFDIIFLDMVMPGMSGIDVLTRLAGNTTPVIILSSVTERDLIIRALENGAKRYVLKPIKKETILRKTEEVLGAYF